MSEFLEIEGKTAVAIMLSGGVESTACIQHALDKDYYPMCFFVSMWPNTYPHMPHVKATCSLYGVEMWDLRLTGREFDRDAEISHYTSHWWAVYGSMIAVAYPKLKYFWIGENSGVRFANDAPDAVTPLEHYGKSLALIESASTMVGGRAKALFPLWKLSKVEQYDMIREDVRPHLVTCEKQFDFEQPRCRQCDKCKEFDSMWDEDLYEWQCEEVTKKYVEL